MILTRRLGALATLLAAAAAQAQESPEAPRTPAPPPTASTRAAASFLPESILAVVELRDGDRQIAAFHKFLDEREFDRSELAGRITSNPQAMMAQISLAGLATSIGTDPWGAVGCALGRDLAIGMVGEAGKPPKVILASIPRDAALADRLITSIRTLAGLTRGGEPDAARSTEVEGVQVFKTGEFAHAWFDGVFLASNSRELMQGAIRRRASDKGSLAATKQYAEARRAAPKEAAIWGRVDLKAVRAAAPEDRAWPEKLNNPLAGFLFGAWYEALRTADQACAWIEPHGDLLVIEAVTDAPAKMPDGYAGFAPKSDSLPLWSAAKLPRFLAEANVARDWAQLFADRESILTLPAAGDVANFSTTLSTIMGGMDFMNDVLTKVNGPTRLILARQDFSVRSILPSPKLPAFALVTPLDTKGLEAFTQRLNSASQSALAILNLDMAQKGQPTYLIDIDRYRDQRILFSKFADPPATEGMKMGASKAPVAAENTSESAAATSAPTKPHEASIRYNFAPAAAVVKDQYVIATSTELLRDVIDAVLDAKSPEKSDPSVREHVTVDARSLHASLKENRSELIVNRMLEEDQSRREAQDDIDAILDLVTYVERADLTGRVEKDRYRAKLDVRLRPATPSAASGKP